jgi:hypothetical protein
MRWLLPLALVLCLSAFAKKKKPERNWLVATVRDSQSAKTILADKIPDMIPTIRDTDLLLISDEFAFIIEDTRASGRSSLAGLTERAVLNRHHGCHFIVNDPVKYWQDRTTLHVIDVDGKDCKVEVVRQERIQKPPSTTHR